MLSGPRSLDELRREIDRIDDAIHDLLMERTAVVEEVGQAKALMGGNNGFTDFKFILGFSIVFITFDSLRADVIGGLGGEKGLTPNLDALLRRSDWAGRGIAPSSWGVPSMASLFTGLRPWQHQVLDSGSRLSPGLLTLPEALQAAGYETAGFAAEASVLKEAGYAQGFDEMENLAKGTDAARLNR